jgi:hypothetical protein
VCSGSSDKADSDNIIITSMEHFQALTNEGYEIRGIECKGDESGLIPTLFLEKGDKKIPANAVEIADYVLRLQPL